MSISTINYFKKIKKDIPVLAKKAGYTNFQMFMEYLRCYLIMRPHWVDFRVNDMYRLSARELRNILIERKRSKVLNKYNPGVTEADYEAIDDKLSFNTRFRDFIQREWLYLPNCGEEELLAFLERNKSVLVKPCGGTKGQGIEIFREGEYKVQEIAERFSGTSCVMEALIQQHPLLAELNPDSVNTVRVVTVRNGDRVMLLGGCLRVGKPGSHVDNFHSGGSAYPLDMERGFVRGAGKTHAAEEELYFSPATGKKVIGLEIPHWDILVDTLRKAAMLTGPVGYVGWDVAITADGVDIVEANVPNPDPKVMQLDGRGILHRLKDF